MDHFIQCEHYLLLQFREKLTEDALLKFADRLLKLCISKVFLVLFYNETKFYNDKKELQMKKSINFKRS